MNDRVIAFPGCLAIRISRDRSKAVDVWYDRYEHVRATREQVAWIILKARRELRALQEKVNRKHENRT